MAYSRVVCLDAMQCRRFATRRSCSPTRASLRTRTNSFARCVSADADAESPGADVAQRAMWHSAHANRLGHPSHWCRAAMPRCAGAGGGCNVSSCVAGAGTDTRMCVTLDAPTPPPDAPMHAPLSGRLHTARRHPGVHLGLCDSCSSASVCTHAAGVPNAMGAAWIDPDGRELGATDGMADGAAQAAADEWLSARAGSSPTARVLVGLLRARIGTAADASALLDDAAMAVPPCPARACERARCVRCAMRSDDDGLSLCAGQRQCAVLRGGTAAPGLREPGRVAACGGGGGRGACDDGVG